MLCGTSRHQLAGGLYCFLADGHQGGCSPVPDGTVPGQAVNRVRSRPEPRSAVLRARARARSDARAAGLPEPRGPRSGPKGKRAEAEVVRIWRAHGWIDAAKSPGSGALRPYGPRDVSPWPADLIGTGPWVVEVKREDRDLLVRGRGGGWVGEAFVRATCRDLRSLILTHRKAARTQAAGVPCVWTRPNLTPWTVWIPVEVLDEAIGAGYVPRSEWAASWVGLDADEFFWRVAGPPVLGRKGGRDAGT